MGFAVWMVLKRTRQGLRVRKATSHLHIEWRCIGCFVPPTGRASYSLLPTYWFWCCDIPQRGRIQVPIGLVRQTRGVSVLFQPGVVVAVRRCRRELGVGVGRMYDVMSDQVDS